MTREKTPPLRPATPIDEELADASRDDETKIEKKKREIEKEQGR